MNPEPTREGVLMGFTAAEQRPFLSDQDSKADLPEMLVVGQPGSGKTISRVWLDRQDKPARGDDH